MGDKKQQAAHIAAQLQDLQLQVERDANAYEAARVRVARLDAQARATREKVAQANVTISRRRHDLAQYALNSYVSAGDGGGPEAALIDSQHRQDARSGYSAVTVGDQQQLVDDLLAAQEVAKERVAELASQETAARSAEDDAAKRRSNADAAAQQQAALYSQVQGELKTLVQAKLDADRNAAQARAYADAQRAAATAAAAQRPASPESSGGAPTANTPPVSVPPPPPIPAPPTEPTPTTPLPPISVPSGDTSIGARAVAAAATKIGDPYVWGAAGPNSFDCSGLTQWAYAQAGVSLPRVTWDQENAGRRIDLSQIQAGDLVFYLGGDHMAMYVGGGTVIHAPYTGAYVEYASLYMYPPELIVRPY